MALTERLGSIATFYHREALKCSRGRAHFGACVMHVASLEAALQAMGSLYPLDVKKTSVYQRKRFRGKRNRVLEFSLYELIKIADELAWFPAKRLAWAGKRATLAGFAHEIRKLRNHLHQGVWAREHLDTTKVIKGVDGVVFEVCDVAVSFLLRRLGY
jgi:hypothetical protein